VLGHKLALPTTILTIVLFTSGIQFVSVNVAYGQSSSPFSNCIMLMMEGDTVQLNMDDDCNEAQWNEAVQHYKANGYPNEESYMDMFGSKFIQLDSDKWKQEQAELDEYFKENK
jgi:hypothetical protein